MYLTKVVVKQIMELGTPTAISQIYMTACEEHVFTNIKLHMLYCLKIPLLSL